MILLDVNVWMAGVWAGHAHHNAARLWIDDQDDDLAFCRVTHMALLRLLTTSAVMGRDVLTRGSAWQVLDEMFLDSRVVTAVELPSIEPIWRVLSSPRDHAYRLWTDDYLAAFAIAGELPLATFDRAFGTRYPSVNVETLGDTP